MVVGVVLVEVVVVLVVVKEEAVEDVLEVMAEGVVALMPMLLYRGGLICHLDWRGSQTMAAVDAP